MSFYLVIAISFYLNIVCKNIVCELGLREKGMSCLAKIGKNSGAKKRRECKTFLFLPKMLLALLSY